MPRLALRGSRSFMHLRSGSLAPSGPPGTWNLAFSDEFSGTVVDTTKWNVLTRVAGNEMNNVQTRPEQVSVASVTDPSTGQNVNCLVLQLSSDGVYGGVVSSSTLDGAGTTGFEPAVGSYTEARIYFPGDASDNIWNWPAGWTSGHSWPTNGEHDFAEGLSGHLTINYHYGTTSAPVANNGPTVSGTWYNAFHTYGVHRKTSTADVYWDGVVRRTYSTSDAGGSHTLLFNIGKSNSRTLHYGLDGAVKVDWVRSWVPAT